MQHIIYKCGTSKTKCNGGFAYAELVRAKKKCTICKRGIRKVKIDSSFAGEEQVILKRNWLSA